MRRWLRRSRHAFCTRRAPPYLVVVKAKVKVMAEVTVGLKTHGEAIWMGELAGVLCGLARAMDLVRDGGVGQEGRDAFSPLRVGEGGGEREREGE